MSVKHVTAYKHNGDIAKIFHALDPVMENDHVIVLHARVGTHVDDMRKKTSWTMTYASYHVLVKNDHYNMLIVEKENGNEYYCNLASPPSVMDEAVSYIDYDIDVVLSPDGEITVHDLDQFAERIITWDYPADLVAQLRDKQRVIEQGLKDRSGYFSDVFYQQLKQLSD